MNKLRKSIFTLLFTIISFLILSNFNQAHAGLVGIAPWRRADSTSGIEGEAYRINADGDYIIKLVDYIDEDTQQSFDNTGLYYCLNSQQGFASNMPDDPVDYDYLAGDLKNVNSISQTYKNQIPWLSTTNYHAVMWLLDNMYLDVNKLNSNSTVSANRTAYLNNIQNEFQPVVSYVRTTRVYPDNESRTAFGATGLNATQETLYFNNFNQLTNNEIDAVQQVAIWYFTNAEQANGNYYFNTASNAAYRLSNHSSQMQALLTYYIYKGEQAKTNLYTPAPATTTSDITLNYDTTKKATLEQNGNTYKYYAGPFTFQGTIPDSITATSTILVNGNTAAVGTAGVQSFTLAEKSGNDIVATTKTIKEIMTQNNKEFYIIVTASNEIEKIGIRVNGGFSARTTRYYSVLSQITSTQPIVKIDETNVPITLNGEVLVEAAPKPFDLALRKYITKVNDTNVTNTRTPVIDSTALAGGSATTATYKHRKDPVQVNTNDIVTYRIAIYNEGGAPGRATKIVDQLPTGLQYQSIVSGNFELGTYDTTNNVVTLNRKSSSTTNLAAYTSGTPASEIIELKCKVTAVAGADDKVLTNIAWISEEFNAETNETITNQTGKDRDSEPSTAPNISQTNLPGYTGNGNKTDLTDSTYYYKGQQDDDDFEKLILPRAVGSYSIRLRKVDSTNNTKLLTGALFTVRLANGATVPVTSSATGDGYVTIASNVAITSTGTDTITITEEEAPTGYKKLIETLTVTLTKSLSGGVYGISAVTLSDGTNASYDLTNNVISITVKDAPKTFDLALRKYITKVNDTAVTNTRTPVIDSTSLANGSATTATYKHRKDPVQVNTNDIVTYRIAIYNEGEAAGRATKIVDQLPTGLQFQEVSSGNFELGTYDTTNNVVTLNRKSSSTTNLAAYTSGTPASEIIELKCKVTAVAGTDDKILTNIAWISEEVNGELNETITNQTGKDRDSVPATHPDVSQTNLPGYTGNGNKTDLTDSTYYYKGQQDDDDFEKLILPRAAGSYSIRLRKVDSTNNTKLLAGAIFTVRLANGATVPVTSSATGDGYVTIASNVAITSTGTDTITITEDEAPTGYKILIDTLTVTLTKSLNGGVYGISAVTLSDGTNASYDLTNNVISITVKDAPKTFDLALRKYITKVNDTAVTNTRTPVIDSTSLANGSATTATYKHRKDPVTVNTNDIVTYRIAIYNEGEAAGRATKIVDQLPTGLQFQEVSSGNFDLDSYDESTNRLSLKRKSGNTTNLAAYVTGTPQSEIIEIKCKVTATAGAADKILTNVAWISEEVNGELNETITNQTGKDRDSEPSTTPNVNKDNMSDYKGKDSNKDDLTDSNYHYEGLQDDDDFEKLRLPKAEGVYSIRLRKVDSTNNTKLLAGALFTVKLANGATVPVTSSATGDGYVTIASNVAITSTGTDTITITEEEAPTGYKKLIETLTVTLTKTLNGGVYGISAVTLSDGTNASYDLTNNVISITVKDAPKTFDLALRKYITKVNDTAVTNTRTPVIDSTSLANGSATTATYKHRKDPVQVNTNDIVTYRIAIYNEGEAAGRATKIVDQLPTGLQYQEISSGNFDLDNYDESTNRLSLKRKSGNTTNLAAYVTGTPQSEIIEIKCKVTAVAGTDDKILTNVAWISEEVNGELNETITNQTGKDRDSEPSTTPNVNKDNMSDYKGKDSNKSDLTDSNYHYEGLQDDDDFEKLRLPKAEGVYSIRLRKVDSTNNTKLLAGAKFSIKLADGSTVTKESISTGYVTIAENVEITTVGTDTITITETQAPIGYKKLLDSLTVTLTKTLSGGVYGISAVTLSDGTNASYDLTNNVISITVKDAPKTFDLALRKYITKVNNVDVTNTRTPVIDYDALEGGSATTATYKHRKDPVTVNTNDIVTYRIAVYNEGEMPGRATKIVDQLPTGLQYQEISSGNFDLDSYDENTNRLSLKRKESNTDNLPGYTTGVPASEIIEIKCKVTATAGAADKILTNVAWISEEVNGETNETITNQTGKDRDSEPSTHPNVNKDNMSDYKGKDSNKSDLTDSNYHYEGTQDDDDFEKLRLPKAEGVYSIRLKKVSSEDSTKTLAGATFRVVLADGTIKENVTSTDSGFVTIADGIVITETGRETITITETNPPRGYKKLLETLNVEVIKSLNGGVYEVSGVNISDSTNAVYDLESNVISITIKDAPKTFDLALRKYITKVGTTDVDNRNPDIETDALDNGSATTATYKHRKDPVTVNTNDVVTYKITVYNEGEMPGRATEIVDQLPTGLQYQSVESGNFELKSYDESTNLLTLKRKDSNTANLAAYTSGTLDSETIEIKCKVTATSGSTEKILTNVAWISREVNGETGEEITNQSGKDRDSEPSTHPNVNKDNMSDYKGKDSNKNDLTDSNYHYEGQQDDDDFEKLRLPSAQGSYTIRLKKVDKNDPTKTLAGAKFNVELPDGTIKTITTTTEEYVTIASNIEITTTGTDTIKMMEDIAPRGYKKLITLLTVEVTKILQGTTYSVSQVRLSNNEYASYDVNGNIITITVQNEEKPFDLALRKYITKVNDIEITNTRNPNIDTDALNNGTTASYKHRKDPLTINTGDVVTYRITVYNEGDAEGRATKIVDQLPTGLQYQSVVDGNFELEFYNESTNLVTLKRKDSNTDNLSAYTTGNLDYESIEIKCKVTAVAGADDKILTNVAWISEEYNAELDETITNKTGRDRDSEPSTHPDVNKDNMSDYKGKDSNKSDLTDSNYHYEGTQDDDDFEKLRLPKAEGLYSIRLRKVSSTQSNKLLAGAKFNVELPDGTSKEIISTNSGYVTIVEDIEITEIGKDTFTITEVDAPKGYKKLLDTLTVEVTKVLNGGVYSISSATISDQTNASFELNGNVVLVTIKDEPQEFDLALRKFITKVEDKDITSRIPQVDVTLLKNGETTATYNHTKEPVPVHVGDKVVYTIRVFNEGEIDGYANEVTDYVPEQLEYISNSEINTQYRWTYDSATRKVTTDYLSYERDRDGNLIKAYDGGNSLNYKDVKIEFRIKKTANMPSKITNIAEITEDKNDEGEDVEDRDSTPDDLIKPDDWPGYKDDEIDKPYVPGQEDDDDFEKVIIKEFDLALRKFITKVGDTEITSRIPQVDVSTLKNGGTTATYNHPKEPVEVTLGDRITYTLRIYNEGDVDGYANEITDYVPAQLEFIEDSSINEQYGWTYDKNTRKVSTDYLSYEKNREGNVIKAYDGGNTLSYKDVKIEFKLVSTENMPKKITNIAEITKDKDKEGNEVEDRDSTPDDLVKPDDWPGYKDDEIDKPYVPGQEDDDDFEKVIIKEFDLALRKFITKIGDTEITSRIPQVDVSPLNNGETTATYTHPKDALLVTTGAIVEYTIRIFNEGEVDGYATEIADDIPKGLEFLPDHETNKKYGWSKIEGKDEVRTRYLENELIKAFDGEKLDYKDVVIAFKVIEPTTSDRIITNYAQISEDKDKDGKDVEDRDSTPDEWKGEDDEDIENIKVIYFDLALRKWVTQAIVTDENGKTTVTETGHKAEDDPEQVVKVDLKNSKINKVTVKFRYSIRVTNEGKIAGYVKEIKDYIPEGLKFVQEDNPNWKVLEGNQVVTEECKDVLLKPGESTEVTIILTWINGANNMGLKDNWAEISKDYNDYDAPDIDSVPNNDKKGEDDIDDAPVILQIQTGEVVRNIALTIGCLTILLGGISLIKKYVD